MKKIKIFLPAIVLLNIIYMFSACTGRVPHMETIEISPSPTVYILSEPVTESPEAVIEETMAEKAEIPEEAEKPEEPEKEAAPSPEELLAAEGLEAANLCFAQIGKNYRYGGKTPETGFDCSGLVYYVYSQLGYSLERTSNYQAKQGFLIEKENIQPGDVLCFGAPSYCGHVGVYVGQGYYIHAMGSEYGVVATALDDPYLKRHQYEIRRIVGCEWLKTENINAALAAGEPLPTPPPLIENTTN